MRSAVVEVHAVRGADPIADALQRRDGVGEIAGIPVAVDHICTGADHRNVPHPGGIERQQVPLVLEQHDGLLAGAPRQGRVLRAQEIGVRNAVVGRGTRRVEFADEEADAEVAAKGGVEVGLGQQSAIDGSLDGADGGAVRDAVHARLDDQGGRSGVIGSVVMSADEPAQIAGIGDDEAMEAPLGASQIADVVRDGAGQKVDGVVSHHVGLDVLLAGDLLEGLEVILAKIAWSCSCGRFPYYWRRSA